MVGWGGGRVGRRKDHEPSINKARTVAAALANRGEADDVGNSSGGRGY